MYDVLSLNPLLMHLGLINPRMLLVLIPLFALLLLMQLLNHLLGSGEERISLGNRLHSWWIILAPLLIAFALGFWGILLLNFFLSILAMIEFFKAAPLRKSDERLVIWLLLATMVQYLWVSMGWIPMAMIFIPIYFLLLYPVRMLLTGNPSDFLRQMGIVHWASMSFIYGLSHFSLLATLQVPHIAGAGGPLVYLLILTETNDAMQYLVGKSLGTIKISPQFSPNKTLEGFLGGLVSTLLLALFLAPILTPLPANLALLSGLIISVGGFFGDLVFSGIKRDVGIKDYGSVLPGHGGLLDRLDSLLYTAPIFFHIYYFFLVR